MKRRFGSPDREWLHPDHFCDQPVYCEAPQNPDDVVYSGSDDEAYDSPSQRRIRYETQARRFLEGKPVFLLSASLRGPFDKASGWVNPWRSKSSARAKRVQKERVPAAKKAKAVRPCDTSGSFGSSSFHHNVPESSAALPQSTHAYIPPPYMDGDTFHRVWDWRDRVAAESEIPTSPSQRASQREPASAGSRRATQQTACRRSGFTGDEADDEPGSSALNVPSVRGDTGKQSASQMLRQNDPGGSPNSTKHHSQPADQPASEETAPKSMSMAEDCAARILGSKDDLKAKITTPNAVRPGATAGSPLPKSHASSRTDGSFRYRRKDARDKGSSSRRSGLAGPPLSLSNTQDQNPANRIPPKTEVEDPEVAGSISKMASPVDVTATKPETAVLVDEVAAGVQEHEKTGGMPLQGHSQSIRRPNEQATEQTESAEDDAAEAPSQIDGPTLVPSESQSASEHASMPSFGHFSCEKLSQDVMSEAVGLPRRLLWPKRGRTSKDSLPVFGLEAVRTPVSNPALERRSVSPCRLGTPEDTVIRHTEEDEAGRAPPAESQPSIQENRLPLIPEDAKKDVEPTSERLAGSEIASEVEDENMDATAQMQAEAEAESDMTSHAKAEVQPSSARPAPEPQTPWIQEEGPLPTSKVPESQELQRNTTIQPAGIQSTPKLTQSPWTKETAAVSGVSGIPQPSQPPDNVQLSFIASQALEQAASQSPWARGDSQMQQPDVRLFNPLSSPASSHVLPTVDATSYSPRPVTEDLDKCNAQLPSAHPSTPATKRSGLLSPDFTLSVKSFKEFMTPSPQRATKKRRISTAADGRLPSTQALVDAAISNPRTRPSTTKPKKKQKHHPRPKKRVSWAPMPDEETNPALDPDMTISSPYSAELATPLISKRTDRSYRSRASSPPPSILSLSASKLPGASQKFGKHFAAVASRRACVTPVLKRQQPQQQQQQLDNSMLGRERKKKMAVSLLPSASQQVCGSPAVGGMAEAFLRADATSAAAAAAASLPGRKGGSLFGDGNEDVNVTESEEINTGEMEAGEEGEDRDGMELQAGLVMHLAGQEESEEGEEEEEGEMTQESQQALIEEEEAPVDEVSAVMENLDDFLGGNWDLEADLAKARAETDRGSRAVSNGGLGKSGLMDVGVWD